MLNNALKIEVQTSLSGTTPIYGTTIYFDEDETLDCSVESNSSCQILESLKHLPDVYDGTKYNDPNNDARDAVKLKIKILLARSTTKAKVDSLFLYKNLMKVYYKYRETDTSYKLCFLDPNKREFYFGGDESKEIVELVFYETTSYYSDGNDFISCGISITPEVIIDPDDKAIKLDGTKDLVTISPIIQRIDMEPSRSGIIENNDISITINNLADYCKAFNNYEFLAGTPGWNPFRSIFSELFMASGTNYVEAYIGNTANQAGAMYFKIGDICRISNATQYEDRTVSSVVQIIIDPFEEPTKYKQRIYFTETLTYTYAINDVIQTWSFVGKKVTINLRIENEYKYGTKTVSNVTVYKGKIREAQQTDENVAVLTVEPWTNEVFSKQLVIKNSALNEVVSEDNTATSRCTDDGSFVSSIAWATKTGTGTLGSLTAYAEATPGYWTVTFSSATAFTVSGPNCSAKAGDTSADFYDQTDASDSQIKIPTAQWSGTPISGDILGFYVSVNYDGKSENQIIYDMLINQCGLTASDIDTTTIFSTSGGSHAISFSEPITVGEVISTVLQGSLYRLTQSASGIFKITYFEQFDYSVLGSTYTAIDTTHIKKAITLKDIKLMPTDIYNEIVINYGWSYPNSEYQWSYTYPDIATGNMSYNLNNKKRTLIINIPSVYASATIAAWAVTMYRFYAYQNIDLFAKVCMPVSTYIEPGYLFKLTCKAGDLGFYVYEKEMNLDTLEISIKGINLRKNYY